MSYRSPYFAGRVGGGFALRELRVLALRCGCIFGFVAKLRNFPRLPIDGGFASRRPNEMPPLRGSICGYVLKPLAAQPPRGGGFAYGVELS